MSGSIITLTGKKIVLNRTYKDTPDYGAPAQFAVGTGTTDPSSGDTGLQTPIQIAGSDYKNVDSGYPDATSQEGTLQASTRCTINTTECNGNSISEYGLFNKDTIPKLFGRATFDPVTKTSSVQLTITERDRIST